MNQSISYQCKCVAWPAYGITSSQIDCIGHISICPPKAYSLGQSNSTSELEISVSLVCHQQLTQVHYAVMFNRLNDILFLTGKWGFINHWASFALWLAACICRSFIL